MDSSEFQRGGIALALVCLAFIAAPAAKAENFPSYQFEPQLSLAGECGVKSSVDPVEDPGCPGGTHPPSGRFDEPRSVAVDAYGNEYVASYASDGTKGRIDVFDDDGFFITEIADPHGPRSIAVDSKGNLYVFELQGASESEIARYTPSVYKPETGEIEYENPRVVIAANEGGRNGLAIDLSNDHLYIAQGIQISEYSSAIEGNKLLSTITHPKLTANTWVALDAQRRRLFASYCKSGIKECGVLVFEADAPFALLEDIDGSTTPAGNFASQKGWTSIAVDEDSGHFFVEDLEASDNVYEFDDNFEYFTTLEDESFQGGNPMQIAVSNSPLNKAARNFEYLFVPVLFGNEEVFAFEPPEELPPKIESLLATNIGETEAELQARIDPGGGVTEYVIEIEGPGLEGAQIITQGTILNTNLPKQVGGLFSSLEPGASYNVRVFAQNKVGDDEEESSFVTYSDATVASAPCPNQALRIGTSANLPDCRAYELVTPADTNGRPIKGAGDQGDRFGMVQSSPTGGVVSFEVTGGILPGTEGTGGFHGDPYRATRSAAGWSTALVGPTGTEASQPEPGSFSPDQTYSFWKAVGTGTAVVNENEGGYIRYSDGHSELIGRGSLGTDPQARGRLITEGGSHVVFQATNVQLEPNAPPPGIRAVYDRTADEITHVVSLLPGNVTPTKESTYLNASTDGTAIAFENEGTLYLRLNNAVTFQIGSKGAVFAGVSNGGKRVFYVEGNDLKAFDTEEEKVIDFSETADAVPVNVAPEGTRAYFVSEAAIPSSGPNPNGAEPQLGEQNLYLSEEGAITFVATVTERDVEGVGFGGDKIDGLGLWTLGLQKRQLAIDPSRLVPDGSILLFQSRANLDTYDSGEFAQVYRYDSTENSLECLSCTPTKLPANGGASLQSFAALDLATPFRHYSFVPNIRADGKRIFFESTEALVSADTDEVRDVYEWEEAGVGSCTRAGGCIYLISSGHSARNNYLFGHSASGDDVFFTTGDVLVGGDEDTVSVYDARVNGGFAEPSSVPCIDETCRGSASPPPFLTAPSKGIGDGNVTPAKTCPKGKRKVKRHGKVVCIKKKHRKHRGDRRKR